MADDPWAEVHPLTYIRIAQLQSSAFFPSLRHLRYALEDRSIPPIFFFLSPFLDSLELFDIMDFEDTIVEPFLATLSSQTLSWIVLRDGGLSTDILKKIFVHSKQLRSLELSNAVFMSDFTLLEVLGTLPSLENLTLKAVDPETHPANAPENSNSQSGGRKYFEALETVSIMGFSLIQHLLGFIDSPCLKSIIVSPVIDQLRNNHEPEPEDLLTPSMTIITSKWSQSLKNLDIDSSFAHRYAPSKCVMLLADFHEIQTFHLMNWRTVNMDDDVRRLVTSWPNLRTLRLPLIETFISLSTLRIIAESCPELRCLEIRLDISTIPPFDTSSKSLRHNLEVLTVRRVQPSQTMLECQTQAARYLDSIFPYLKSTKVRPENPNDVVWSGILDLVKLCQDIRRVTTSSHRIVTSMSGSHKFFLGLRSFKSHSTSKVVLCNFFYYSSSIFKQKLDSNNFNSLQYSINDL